MAVLDGTFVNTCHSSDIVPAAHVAGGDGHVFHGSILADGTEESTVATAGHGFFRLKHADDVAATIKSPLVCRAVGRPDGSPRQRHILIGDEVVGQPDIGLGPPVVHIVGYPIEVTEGLDDKHAVLAVSRLLHLRLLIGMETARAAADAIGVVVMSQARFLEHGLVKTLAARIFHQSVLAVLAFFGALVRVVVWNFLEESTAVAVKHVRKFVNGNLLLAEIDVTGRLDQVAIQASLVV